jgi:hypothetical protein
MPKKLPETIRLGKSEYKHDERTVRMATMLIPGQFDVPNTWDFDSGRAKLPMGLWGNDEWGDCVLVGRANQLVRMERVETRHTLNITTQQVVNRYKEMTGALDPGDDNDTGLIVLDALKDWRNNGWDIGKRNYRIAAYGELDRTPESLRAGAFLLNGIQMGLWLPLSARDQIRNGQEWEDLGTSASNQQPGSWGGHLVHAKRYDANGFYCITWGREQYMTNRFIDRYCDEAWAVVDALDAHSRYLDVDKMLKYLSDIGAIQS